MKRSTTILSITLSLCALGHLAPVEAGSVAEQETVSSTNPKKMTREEKKDNASNFQKNRTAWKKTPQSTKTKIKNGKTFSQHDVVQCSKAGHHKNNTINHVRKTNSCIDNLSEKSKKHLKDSGWSDHDISKLKRSCHISDKKTKAHEKVLDSKKSP